MQVRIITLWQPWATLLALGIKQNETRPRAANYAPEDPVLIHAACAKDAGWRRACDLKTSVYHRCLDMAGIGSYNELPFGAIVGEFKVQEFVTSHGGYVRNSAYIGNDSVVSGIEFLLGDYEKGRSIWLGTDHRQLAESVPYKNGQGYYQKFKGDYNQLQFKL